MVVPSSSCCNVDDERGERPMIHPVILGHWWDSAEVFGESGWSVSLFSCYCCSCSCCCCYWCDVCLCLSLTFSLWDCKCQQSYCGWRWAELECSCCSSFSFCIWRENCTGKLSKKTRRCRRITVPVVGWTPKSKKQKTKSNDQPTAQSTTTTTKQWPSPLTLTPPHLPHSHHRIIPLWHLPHPP